MRSNATATDSETGYSMCTITFEKWLEQEAHVHSRTNSIIDKKHNYDFNRNSTCIASYVHNGCKLQSSAILVSCIKLSCTSYCSIAVIEFSTLLHILFFLFHSSFIDLFNHTLYIYNLISLSVAVMSGHT